MRNKKILVVEDEDSIRKTFSLVLNNKYRVYAAQDGREAMQRARTVRPDLIIVDLKLPDTSGLELVARIRESGYRGEAILISAFPDMVDIVELARRGIGHFFVKPLDLETLSRSIDVLLASKADQEKRL